MAQAGMLFKRDPHVRSHRLQSDLALAPTQGVQLCLVQSLRDVRDQIGGVFDADRQPDRGLLDDAGCFLA
jgi:hypothetical protein